MDLERVLVSARRRLAHHANRVLLGAAGGDVASIVRSIPEASYRPHVARHVRDDNVWLDPCIHTYRFPADYPPWFRRAKAFDERRIYLLQDVVVSPRSGQVWTQSGSVFMESVGSLRRMIGWAGTHTEPLLAVETAEVDEPLVACPAHGGYYHWLLEALPGVLEAMRRYPNAHVVVDSSAPSYVRAGLELILGTEAADRVLVRSRPVHAANVVLPGREPFSGFVRDEDVGLLHAARGNSALRGGAPSASGQPDGVADAVHGESKPARASQGSAEARQASRIYVSRRKSPKRALDNERDLEVALERVGYRIVFAEDLSLRDQMALFASADVIVSPHGAGLANIVWSRHGALLVEIFPADAFNDCYARLAGRLGINYDHFNCVAGSAHGVIPVDDVLGLLDRLTQQA